MSLTNNGLNAIVATLGGGSSIPFNNANAYIGVGDSTVPFSPTQIDLQATTNYLRKPVDSGFPTAINNVLNFQATFGTNDANFTWNEWGIFNSATQGTGTMLNRKQNFLGTKTSSQTWEFSVSLTLNAS